MAVPLTEATLSSVLRFLTNVDLCTELWLHASSANILIGFFCFCSQTAMSLMCQRCVRIPRCARFRIVFSLRRFADIETLACVLVRPLGPPCHPICTKVTSSSTIIVRDTQTRFVLLLYPWETGKGACPCVWRCQFFGYLVLDMPARCIPWFHAFSQISWRPIIAPSRCTHVVRVGHECPTVTAQRSRIHWAYAEAQVVPDTRFVLVSRSSACK